jgi:hypothetical protein
MKRLTRAEFQARFPRPRPGERFSGTTDTLVADRDMTVDGLLRHLIVRSGANVIVKGLVEESLTVEHGAIVYVDGLIDGTTIVNGAVCVDAGHLSGKVRGSGVVFDPTNF